jgi:hypothetical protein
VGAKHQIPAMLARGHGSIVFTSTFERAVANAVSRGDAPPQDAKAAASYLLSTLQGMAVLAKAGATRDELKAIAKRAMASLQHPLN